MMKRNLKLILLYIAALLVLATVGCATKENKETNNSAAAETADLLYQATVSPNEQYAESDEDVVYYTVEVYQNEENIIVSADSNSEFFDRMQYVILCNKKILEADIQVEWTTLMGNPKPAKDDQLAVAQVTISENGEIISQRKINFARKAIEVIADAGN